MKIKNQDQVPRKSILYDSSRRPTRSTTTLQKIPIKIQMKNGLLHVWSQLHSSDAVSFAVQSTARLKFEDPCTGWLEVLNGYNYQLSATIMGDLSFSACVVCPEDIPKV